MTWFRRHRLSAAEALELELAGIVTDSSAAELRPVTDLLHAAARGLPPPTALRPRRRELVALGTGAARVGQPDGRRGRLIRAPLIALAVATIAVASVLGATLVASWLHVTPPSISEPASVPDASAGPSDGSSEHPHPSQSEPPDATDPTLPLFSDELSAELLAALQAACGEEAALPGLSSLDGAEARALVDALIAACQSASEAPLPVETSMVLPERVLAPELLAELLSELQAACGEEAAFPDLSDLDEAEARALVDALIAACEALPGALLP
jgi:hypothetical protein